MTGITLSVYPIGENDRRLTILTKERGKIQVFARGCRKPNHPLFGVSQPLVFAEFFITEGRTYNYLNSAEGRDYFPHLKADLESICYSTYFSEVAEYFTVEGLDESNMLNLLFVTFSAMKKKQVPFPLIRLIFELKALQIYGIGLEVFQCISCGTREDLSVLSIKDGGIFCKTCGEKTGGFTVKPSVLYTLQYILGSSLKKLYRFTLTEEAFSELETIVRRFFQFHADHRFKSAEMLDKL